MFYSILLAGGKSSRMGLDKGTLDARGETLLMRALKLLNNAGAEKILLSGSFKGQECIPDVVPNSGPLGGIYSSLDWLKINAQLDNSLLIVIPVDMPMLNEKVLLTLLESAESTNESCCHYKGEVFPCVIRASEEVYSYLKETLTENSAQGKKCSMKGLMRHLMSKELGTTDLAKQIFMNINKPEDWQAFIDM